MSTFYLLPTRRECGRRFSAYLQTWFPGIHPPADEMTELLATTAERSRGAIVLFADDLPVSDATLDDALRDGFGAEPLDRVIDLRSGPVGGDSELESWVLRGKFSSPLRKVS